MVALTVTPALERLKWEDQEFKVSQGHRATP
jgi:hypothetical protein